MNDQHDELLQRVAKLEAINAIRTLKYDYAAACDDGYPPEIIAPMFTVDAVWDGGSRWGRHEGRDAIAAHFAAAGTTISFALHLMIGGDIVVDDSLTSASGRWQLYEPVAVEVDGQGVSAVMAGIYHDGYALTEDGWKFSEMRLDWAMQARLDRGWADDRFHL